MARLERFELPTARFVAEYSIQLSYRRMIRLGILRIFSLIYQRKLAFGRGPGRACIDNGEAGI